MSALHPRLDVALLPLQPPAIASQGDVIFANDGQIFHVGPGMPDGLRSYDVGAGLSVPIDPNCRGALTLDPAGMTIFYNGVGDDFRACRIASKKIDVLQTWPSGHSLAGIGFAPNGGMFAVYGLAPGDGRIVQLDPGTGAILAMGSERLALVGRLCHDRFTGNLFALSEGAAPTLIAIDPATLQIRQAWHDIDAGGARLDGISSDQRGHLFISAGRSPIRKLDLTRIDASRIVQSPAGIADASTARWSDEIAKGGESVRERSRPVGRQRHADKRQSPISSVDLRALLAPGARVPQLGGSGGAHAGRAA
jgi:hypothetical protein